MTEEFSWLSIATLLAVIVGAAVLWLVRASVLRRRGREALTAQENRAEEAERTLREAHRLQTSRLEDEQTVRVSTLEAEHRRAVDAVEAVRDREQEAREAAEQETAAARERLAHTWRSEAVSHRLLVEACTDAGLSGTLLTNVVFAVEGPSGVFLAQIDHVLLTSAGALIIESKHWQGIVFDGVLPSTIFGPFRALFDEDAFVPPFAVQIAPDTAAGWAIRSHLGEKSPVAQVRRQSVRLSAFVTERLGDSPWFDTAVLYCHAGASHHVEPEFVGAKNVTTRVIAGRDPLRATIAGLASGSTRRVSEDRLVAVTDLLAAQGARVDRFGPE